MNQQKKEYKDLYLLLCYSINHLLRFNSEGKFNAANGTSCYNEKTYERLKNFQKRFKNVEVLNKDIFDLDLNFLTDKDFIYLDPPYTNINAFYNESSEFGTWDIECDKKLFHLLEELDNKGVKWGMSNVFANRSTINTHLVEWCQEHNWNVFHLNIKYSPFAKGNSNSDEVYICNYN